MIISPKPAEVRARGYVSAVVAGAEGEIRPDPPFPWPTRFALADTNPAVAEVLDIMGNGAPLGFAELYKVHEIIRDGIKPNKICDLGWADKTTDSAFTGSANRLL